LKGNTYAVVEQNEGTMDFLWYYVFSVKAVIDMQ